MSDPVLGVRRLVQLWTELELTRVLGFGVKQVVGLPRLALGGLGRRERPLRRAADGRPHREGDLAGAP